MRSRLRVGVIFGGRSGEHEVSLASSRSIMDALDPDRYEVVPIGITHSGRWLTAGNPMAVLSEGTTDDPTASVILSGAKNLGEAAGRELVPGATGTRFPPLDVAFPVLHGPYGEDGTLQGLLEIAGVPYVGCGVLASALAMDKVASKELFMARGLPVAAWRAVSRRDWEADPDEALAAVEAALRYPMFVKPANLGSSIGISKARTREQLRAGLDDAARYDRKLLVEEAVPNAREIECSVLGNDDPIASVPGEVLPCNEFYDYDAKYIAGRSEVLIPAPLPPRLPPTYASLASGRFGPWTARGWPGWTA